MEQRHISYEGKLKEYDEKSWSKPAALLEAIVQIRRLCKEAPSRLNFELKKMHDRRSCVTPASSRVEKKTES